MRTPPLIRDLGALQKEVELMEALAEIEVSTLKGSNFDIYILPAFFKGKLRLAILHGVWVSNRLVLV